jgi:hypothetical protein
LVEAVNLLPNQTQAPSLAPTITPELSQNPGLPETATAAPAFSATSTQTATPTSIPITPLAFDTLFKQCNESDFTFGGARLLINPGCEDTQKGSAIQLDWQIPNNQGGAGCIIPLESISENANRNPALVFWARSNYPNEKIAIKLKDDVLEESKLVDLSTEWQQVVLTLLYDFPGINVQKIQALTVGIDFGSTPQNSPGVGDACFRDFGFGTP